MQAEERKKQKEHMKILKQQVFIYFLNMLYLSYCERKSIPEFLLHFTGEDQESPADPYGEEAPCSANPGGTYSRKRISSSVVYHLKIHLFIFTGKTKEEGRSCKCQNARSWETHEGLCISDLLFTHLYKTQTFCNCAVFLWRIHAHKLSSNENAVIFCIILNLH